MTDTSEAITGALLPCPLCGCAVTLEPSKNAPDRLFVVKCSSDSPCIGSGLGGFYILESQLDDGIAAWNRRIAPPSREDGLREAVLEEAEKAVTVASEQPIYSAEMRYVAGHRLGVDRSLAALRALSHTDGGE